MVERLWGLSLRVVHTWLVVWLTLGPTHPLIAATFYVDPQTGDDTRSAQEAQDPSTPWKTLTHASLASLATGDTVDLAPGQYDENSGESFPIALPSGIHLQGAGTGETLLYSQNGNYVLTHSGPLAAGTQVTDLAIDVSSSANGKLEGHGGFALQTEIGNVELSFDSVYFRDGLNSAVSQSNPGEGTNKSDVTITNSTIEAYRAFGYEVTSFSADHDITLNLINNQIRGTQGTFVGIYGTDGDVNLNLTSQGNFYQTNSDMLRFYESGVAGFTTWNVAVTGDSISGYGGIELSVSSATSVAGIDIDLDISDSDFNTDETNHLYSGIYYINGAEDINASYTLSNNSFAGNGSALYLSLYEIQDASADMEYSITNNRFSEVDEAIGIGFYDLDNVDLDSTAMISGNTYSNLSDDVFYISLSSPISVTANLSTEFSNNEVDGAEYGIYVGQYYMYASSNITSNLLMSGNTMSNISGNGLYNSWYSQSSTGTTERNIDITDNIFTNVGREYQSSTLEINAFDADYDTSLTDNITITGNTILGSGASAIDLSITSFSSGSNLELNLSISGNTIQDVDYEGIRLYVYSFSSSATVDIDATIVGNTINATGGNGISVDLTSISSSGSLHADFTIAGNTISNAETGIDISISSLSSLESNVQHYNIHNNIIKNVGTGINFFGDTLGEGELTDFSVGISGNTITNVSGHGIDVSLNHMFGGIDDRTYKVEINGNTIDVDGEGSGLDLDLSGDEKEVTNISAQVHENVISGGYRGIDLTTESFNNPDAWVSVAGNTLTDNYIGLYLGDSASYSDTDVFPVDLGGGGAGSPGNNIFVGNGQYDIDATVTRGDVEIPARGNYFGTTPRDSIDARIGDDDESEGSALAVNFESPRDTRPEVSAIATLTATISEDNQLQGPGPGDVVTYEAKLTSTGDIGCASGTFTIMLPDGLSLTNPVANRGTVIHQSASHLEVGLKWFPSEPATVQFDVILGNEDTCEAPTLQGVFACTQLGEIVTDDPSTEGDVDATSLSYTKVTFFADQDNDGWGDEANSLTVCTDGIPAGYLPAAGDCDDDDNDIYPNAVELCDGQDNNCNEAIDDGAGAFWFADSDNDGQGNDEDSLQACEQPSGYSPVGGDCDDNNDDVFIGATEVCNEIDDDCDQFADEGVLLEFNADQDGDGYGDPGTGEITCVASEGYVDNKLDCDDSDEDVNQDATEECDGIDNNCNNSVDEGAGEIYFADQDDDGFGDPGDAVVGCGSAPAGYVDNSDDCDDDDDEVNPDGDEVCDGIDNNCNNDTDEDVGTFYFGDEDGDGFGSPDSVVLACDDAPNNFVDNSDDCDDSNEDVNPDAEEVCDGIDNNCNSDTDEEVTTTYFADVDGDGFGGASDVVQACAAPEGYLENSADCNDEDATINPDATDVCDSVDNDCSGVADDGDEVCDVVPTDASPTPDIDVSGGGCGCASPEDEDSQRGAFLMLLGLALWRRRRS